MKKPCIIFATGAILGGVATLFFARESGADFRKKLEKSKNPARDIFREIVEIKLDALKWMETKGREMLNR